MKELNSPPAELLGLSGINSVSDEFWSLWAPFGVEIGRLTGTLNGPGPDELTDPEAAADILARHRTLIGSVFADAEGGGAAAQKVVETLGVVMRLFAARVTRVIERGEFLEVEGGQGSALAVGAAADAPGRIALRQLAGEVGFLQVANAYSSAFHYWLLEQVEGEEEPSTPAKTGKRRANALPPVVRFSNNAVHATAVRGLARSAEWEPRDDWAFAFEHGSDGANVIIGLPSGEEAKDFWGYLRDKGPKMVKAHYALWARYYEDIDQGGSRFVFISIPQFCSDLGFAQHKKGGYRLEQRQEVLKMLRALTSVEISAEREIHGKVRRIRGPLWSRGLEAQERDAHSSSGASSGAKGESFSDLFGRVGEGDPSNWEPVAFSFAPGHWFEDDEWKRYGHHIGKIGVGLLRLDNREEWAILIGGYLAILGRNNGYRPFRVKIGTILREVGLAQTKDAQRRAKENREKFLAAMDRLTAPEIGVLKSWRTLGVEVQEPNMDDQNSLADYGTQDEFPPGDYRSWVLEIELPFEDDALRLASRKRKAIGVAKARKTRKANAG